MAKHKPKILTVANVKGGSGKSTLAINLAGAVMKAGRRVILVDTDPQESATDWRSIRQLESLEVLQMLTPAVYDDAQALDTDLVIIDAGGRSTDTFRAALCAADGGLVLVPVIPSPLDIWATASGMIEALELVRANGFNIKARAVLNQTTPSARLVNDAEAAVVGFGKALPLLSSRVGSRAAFRRSFLEGKTVFEIKDAEKARVEIEALYLELAKLIKL